MALSGTVEMEGGTILPSADDTFAEFVFINLRRGRGLLDFRKHEAVALLHVEHRVVTKNKRDAAILARVFFVFLRRVREAAYKRQSAYPFRLYGQSPLAPAPA